MVEQTNVDGLDGTPHADAFEGTPRTVRLELDAGESVPEHSHPGTEIVFHQLAGELTVRLDGDAYDVGPGDLLRFSGDRQVEPVAKTDCRALIVIAPAET